MKPWLWLPPSWSHRLAPLALRTWTLAKAQRQLEWRPLEWRGLRFSNRLGLAAGLDKNADQISEWWKLGVGFLEVGTVVPAPQSPNPGRIMDRQASALAVWNKMGFPSPGLEVFSQNLRRLKRPFPAPVFVNVGKNRTTSNARALLDYQACVLETRELCDGFVVNISSPNTAGLRELAKKEYLEPLLLELKRTCENKPLLLKLSPDMEDLAKTLETAAPLTDGFVLTNTTTTRAPGLKFPTEGGVSGLPLKALSESALKIAVQTLGTGHGKLLISVGGVMSPEDVERRLELGADLVEAYSALIFEGPRFFHDVGSHFLHNKV